MRVLLAARRLAAAVCAGAGLLVIPHAAAADGTGVVATTPVTARALAAAMGGRSARVAPDAVHEARVALAAGAVPVESLARFRRVREQVDAGWRAYLRVAVEVAAVKLAGARADAEALVALPGGAELYADAALRLGVALDYLGRGDEARAAITLALALDPRRPLTLAEFSPDVLERVEAVRAAVPGTARLAIAVVGTDPGDPAHIELDGVEVGTAPLALAVARGQHLVVARARGRAPAIRAVAVGDSEAVGTAVAVELTLEPDVDAVALATGVTPDLTAAAVAALTDAALRYADLDEVVLAAVTTRRGGPTLLVQRCAGIPARCSAVVDVGYGDPSGLAAAAREAWAAVRVGELRYPPTVVGDRARSTPRYDRCRGCRSPWVWSGVGAALVIGAVVTAIAVSGGDRATTIVIDPGPFTGR